MIIVQPLQLDYWLIQVFSGTEEIFAIVALLAITAFCAKLRMNIGTYFAMLIFFSALMTGIYGMNAILLTIILIGGPLAYFWIRKLVD